jgi:hypothetical protein
VGESWDEIGGWWKGRDRCAESRPSRRKGFGEPLQPAARRAQVSPPTTIEPFIVDFLCPAKALIVEVDGETHVAEDDARRDAALAGRGCTTIRFTNDEVMSHRDGVLTVILQKLESLPDRWTGLPDSSTPTPPPKGRGFS